MLAVVDAYLLVLLAAAAAGRRRAIPPDPAGEELTFVVLVPAHDEEPVIAATLDSLTALDYPPERVDVVVVADNCTDATAAVARNAGATVLEREDPTRRGKGHALAWAFDRILEQRPDVEAVCVVDADCAVSPNLLRAVDRRLRNGAVAVQVDNVVANPEAGHAAALRFAAFTLLSTVRCLGKTSLGLSAGLLGTGMGFRRELLERVPWESFSVTEDAEQHLRLVAAGERVVFAPEARVESSMPTSLRQTRQQQERWEGGRAMLVREWLPRLLREGIARRDAVRVHAALEPLVPPQSLLFAANALLAVAAVVVRPVRALALVNLVGQVAFVLGGLRVAAAPPAAYRALAAAPALVAMKLSLFARMLLRGGPEKWVRTERR